MKNIICVFLLFCAITASSAIANDVVIDLSQLEESLKQAQPGDVITVKSGSWADMALEINATGTKDAPITIKAQSNGDVIITGSSTMKIGGEYLIIEGFYFKDGNLSTTPVITFKEGGKVANHCRLTQCTIDNYNPDNRFLKSDWIALYGQHNQIDHCSFTNKYSSGLMLAVKLSGKENQNNYHRIEYNYFANRPRLGSNGGETVRIGTSTYSLEPAHVNFTNNYFEHCSGEVEILSVKSTDNVISGNVFYECEGVLALRHGNNNEVTHNIFIGNGRPNTGGIRVINAGHTISNNHFQDLTGFRFWSALAVMNGVPNSAINRYHQVKDVTLANNTWVNCDNIAFGIGSDNERTALPDNVVFKNNYIYNDKEQEVLFLDDMSGVTFTDNVTNNKVKVDSEGFKCKSLKIKKQDELSLVKGKAKIKSVNKDTYGAQWYTLGGKVLNKATQVIVNSGEKLEDALNKADDYTVIVLNSAETFYIKSSLIVSKKIKIKKQHSLENNPLIKFKENIGEPLMVIAEGGDLTLEGVDFEGLTEGGIAPCAIKTQDEPFLAQYNLRVDACNFYNFNAGGRTVFSATPTSIADSVVFSNCTFHNISGIAINLKAEKDDIGRYNAENIIVKNCLFYDVMGAAVDVYRGGNDESTSGPKLTIDHCTFHNVENRELGSVIYITGLQYVDIRNCIFSECGRSGRVINMESPGWAPATIDYCSFYHSGRIETFYDYRLGENIWDSKPDFTSIEDKDFTIKTTSSLQGKASDGSNLGYQK